MIVWVWVVPPETAGPLVVACSLLGQLLSLRAARKGFDLRRAAPLIIGGIIGVPLGAWLLPRISPDAFKIALGCLLVLWCPVMLRARNLPRVAGGGIWGDVAAGWVGGVMGGLGGFSGPAPTLWSLLRGWEKDAQRATFQAFHVCMHTLTLTAYFATGLVTAQTGLMFAVAGPAMAIPSLLGARLYARVSPEGFRRVILCLLLASGVALLGGTAVKLLR